MASALSVEPGARPLTRRLPAMLPITVLAPALVTAALVYHYGVDVPFWDEWVIGGLLQSIDQGTATPASFFAQHNEHRPAVQRVVQVLQSAVTGWNMRAMMALTQILLLAMLAGCVVLWRRARPATGAWSAVPLVIASLLLFSPSQHQNLMWAFQFCFFMPSAGLLGSVVVAGSPRLSLGGALAWTIVFCSMATFSLLAGLFTWPLAAAAVMLARGLPSRGTWKPWTAWVLATGAVIGGYFWDYVPPANSPSVLAALGQPHMLAVGFFACLGSAFSVGSTPLIRGASAVLAGVAGFAAFIWLATRIVLARDGATLRIAAPWLVMGAFACIGASAITAGRVGYSLGAILESRYRTITLWLFIACVMLAAVLRAWRDTPGAIRRERIISAAVLILSLLAYPFHLGALASAHRERLGAQAVVTFAEASASGWPDIPVELDWAYLTQVLQHLERTGWRAARPAAPSWVDLAEAQADCRFGVVEDLLEVRGRVMANGWAFLPASGRPADAVLATAGTARRVVGLAPFSTGRVDVGERFQLRSVPISGWFFDVTPAVDERPLSFWALDVTRLEAYPLCAGAATPPAGGTGASGP